MKASDRYETPPYVFEAISRAFGPFTLDVCATAKTKKCAEYFGPDKGDDALALAWYGRCWCNPPYSDPMPWVAKAMISSRAGAVVVMLLPGDTSTAWYQLMYKSPDVILFHPAGRVRFLLDGVEQGSPKFGSVVAVFHPPISLKKPKQ
ncbi:MAG: phage N-6-adenine-methyltransferase [Spirochaetes bacterium]|nr:MAG: phage N-6-adenine-methyltransferase [Spirochaetota bacterium]